MRKAAYFCIVIVTIIYALIYGESLMLPFLTAFLLWFLTVEIRNSLNRFSLFDKYVPNGLKNIVVFALMFFVLSEMIEVLISNISELANSYEKYQTNLQKVLDTAKTTLDIDLEKRLTSIVQNFDVGSMVSSLVNSLSGFLGNMMMILIYALFIFLEETSIKEKIHKVFDTKENYDWFMKLVRQMGASLFNYLRLKTLVSLVTGILSYVALLLVGIDSPMFWAFLIFLLNFIPTIGSLIATVFPAVFSLVQFGTITPFLIILALVGGVQLVVGNVIEPRVMGHSLNVSPLVTIIALAVWGKIWGIPGMILSVPFTVIMIIVFSQFEQTKKIAILLTETGEINE